MVTSLRLLRLLLPIVLTGAWAWFIFRVSSATSPLGIGADSTSILDFLPRPDF